MDNFENHYSFEEKILKLMEIYDRPVTATEITKEFDTSRKYVYDGLAGLLEKGKIVKVPDKNNKYTYYALNTNSNHYENALSQKYISLTEGLEEKYKKIEIRNEELEKRINSLYANILTLMGIFVALFALIVVNVQAINTFVASLDSVKEMFLFALLLNIPLVISIVILLIVSRLVIKSLDFKKTKKDDE